MNEIDTATKILLFFECISKYYNCKTELTEGIVSDIKNLQPEKATWNLSEFILDRSAYRTTGNKFMLEGNGIYYELSAEKITNFKQLGRNKFEFIEQYSDTIFRITKIRFHYKY